MLEPDTHPRRPGGSHGIRPVVQLDRPRFRLQAAFGSQSGRFVDPVDFERLRVEVAPEFEPAG